MLRYYTSSFVFLLTTNLQNNCFLSSKSANTVRVMLSEVLRRYSTLVARVH